MQKASSGQTMMHPLLPHAPLCSNKLLYKFSAIYYVLDQGRGGSKYNLSNDSKTCGITLHNSKTTWKALFYPWFQVIYKFIQDHIKGGSNSPKVSWYWLPKSTGFLSFKKEWWPNKATTTWDNGFWLGASKDGTFKWANGKEQSSKILGWEKYEFFH